VVNFDVNHLLFADNNRCVSAWFQALSTMGPCKTMWFLCSAYFASWGKSTAGVILPSAKIEGKIAPTMLLSHEVK